ncbi:MAG TPA: VWA domain-containing protein [Vicinamibacterales bacterium]|nr:VWA domain-containing protein [Vicinamibacterales bacterium]
MLLFPGLLLLAVPLVIIYYWRGRSSGIGAIVRLVALALLALLAAVPIARLGGKGVDVVIVADLSRSMPPDSRARGLEIVKLIEQQRATGDRVGIVTFGQEARIERLPEEFAAAADFVQQVDGDGSDLGGAISLAASLIPRSRPGRILVLSDGESTGAPVMAAAHDAGARGIPIDYRLFSRGEAADIAVEALDPPGVVDEREPFQFTASVRTDRTVESDAVLFRDGVEVARTRRTFRPGATQLTFRDVIDRPGVARYRLEIAAANDRVPENNLGEGAVRVQAPAALLLVNAGGGPDNLSRAMTAGKLRVVTTTTAAMPRDLAGLTSYRGVILENVPATQVGPSTLEALTHYAADLGGGVLVTGGTASFGVGGYFKSALDPFLPVSMELQNEHRKLSLAMVVALDRSGSMAMAAADGRTKMDLANLGTCAAIETLGPMDEVGVIAIDSAPHQVTPLTSAEQKTKICDEVRRIQSMGGGIFTYTALVAAAKMVQESNKGTRHIVLFADANDAEQPGDYERLLATLTSIGITVSVIGLGKDTDSDAAFLKDVASRGNGRIEFTESAEDLPRLFAQEAIMVARSSFITEPTPARALPDMVLLGDLPPAPFSDIEGYNLTYLRPGATIGVVTTDEYKAPVLAFWHRGLGRVASVTAEMDGRYSQRFNAWKGFQGFAVGIGRWLLGGDPPTSVQATIERQGGEGIVRVDLDPARARGGGHDIRTATASMVSPGGAGDRTKRLELAFVGEDTLEARFPMLKPGIYLGAVRLGDGDVLPLAPLTLPYSPEFEPRVDPKEGETLLAQVARVTGGSDRATWTDVFDASRLRNREFRELVIPLALVLLLLHLLEIAGRRLLFFAAAQGWLRTVAVPKLRWPSRRPAIVPPPAASAPTRAASATTAAAAAKSAPVAPPPAATRPRTSALERAKGKARDRMGR